MDYDKEHHKTLLAQLDTLDEVHQCLFGAHYVMLFSAAIKGQRVWLKVRQDYLSEIRSKAEKAGFDWGSLEKLVITA